MVVVVSLGPSIGTYVMRQVGRGGDRDRELGMDRPIARRDFLNGAAVAIGATLAGPTFAETGEL